MGGRVVEVKVYLLLFLVLIGIVLVSGCVQEGGEQALEIEPPAEVKIHKGIWTPSLLSGDTNKLASGLRELRDMGANTVFFQAGPPQIEHCLEGVSPDSELAKKMEEIIPVQEELIIANIQAAHRNGLRVGLTMGKCMPASEEISLEAWNSKVIEYAKLAEEYDVELFAPMNEPEVLFGPSASATWGQEILPKIREVYHGQVIWKGGATGDIEPPPGQPGPNFSGYDYVGFTIGVGSGITLKEFPQPLEEFSQRVDYWLDTILRYAERDNCTGVMITEFYGRLPGKWEKEAWSEETEARAHEIVLEKGKDKVDGFFALDFVGLSFFGEEIPGMPVPERSSKTEEVVRRWFTGILE
jgi:hypothetical protein